MKKLLLLSVMLLSLVGCKGNIHVSSIEGALVPTLDRHDAYVKADTTLAPVQKDIALRSSALLRQTVEEAKK